MISAMLRRWRALRVRSRAATALLAMTTLLAIGLSANRWRRDSWPARAELRSSMAAVPLAFSPDGRTFLTNGRGGITSWDVASGRKGELWEYKSGQTAGVVAFSPDGKTFATAIFDPPQTLSIDLFDTSTGRTSGTLKTPRRTILHLKFDDDGRTVRAFLGDDPQINGCSSWNPAYGGDLNEVVTWDAATGRQISTRPLTAPTREAITAISPDARVLAIADRRTNTVQLWDLDADCMLGRLANPASASAVNGAGMAFSGDGRTLAIARVDGTIELWDVSSRRIINLLRDQTDGFAISMIRLSPDGRTLTSTGNRGVTPLSRIPDAIRSVVGLTTRYQWEIVVLETATGLRLAGAPGSSLALYSPDGKTLATGQPDGSTRLRDIPIP